MQLQQCDWSHTVWLMSVNPYFLPLSGFLGPACCDLAGGGLGITPACPNKRATGAEG